MNAAELIEMLEVKGGPADMRPVAVLINDTPHVVTGVDSYDDALVLVTEPRP